jgi:hypothetical protein
MKALATRIHRLEARLTPQADLESWRAATRHLRTPPAGIERLSFFIPSDYVIPARVINSTPYRRSTGCTIFSSRGTVGAVAGTSTP